MKLFEPRFVDGAPPTLEPGVLYVSIRHKSVLHLCACGCGYEVVTPLAPHRWSLAFDGETVSLEPSIGNSALPCRSHYYVTNNRVDWHRPMTDKTIEWARRRDQRALDAVLNPLRRDPRIAGAGIDSGADDPAGTGVRSQRDGARRLVSRLAAVAIAATGRAWANVCRRLGQ